MLVLAFFFCYNKYVVNMDIEINNIKYNIIIKRKISTKNTYIRVNKNLEIIVTTNILTANNYILDLINKNKKNIEKMINKINNKIKKEQGFYYLGKKYDIIYWSNKNYLIGENKIFIYENFDLNKLYKKEASIIFKNHLDIIYNNFKYKIDYPNLTIRKMTSRWGVCNTKTKRVTLNLELIKKDTKYLDYVIIHELCHLLHANHSKSFWKCVETMCPNYKILRREMNDE